MPMAFIGRFNGKTPTLSIQIYVFLISEYVTLFSHKYCKCRDCDLYNYCLHIVFVVQIIVSFVKEIIVS